MLAVGEGERERLRGRGKLRAETIGLKLRAVSQLAAADAGGKTEKVLDQRRRSGLSARRIAFQDDRLQPFGRGIDRRAETGWTRADDGEIADKISLSSSAASGRSSPATRATSRNDGRRSGRPFGVISAGRSRDARCRRCAERLPCSLAASINRCGM